MNIDLLSVVDEDDCVIDICPRHIIHATGLKYRTVHIPVFDGQGQLFLQKRSMNKDLNRGLWDTSAAGHVDAGEDCHVSALREVEEELASVQFLNRGSNCRPQPLSAWSLSRFTAAFTMVRLS